MDEGTLKGQSILGDSWLDKLQISIFRFIVLTSAVLYIVLYSLPYESFERNIAAANLLKLDGYGATFTPRSAFFGLGIAALWLVASLGLIRFKNWARYLYLALTTWSVVAAALYGIRVSTPAEQSLGLLVDTLDGVILGLVFLSPVKAQFVR